MRFSKGERAVLVASSILPAMYAAGMAVGQMYKHYNPAGVDINSGLAYLREGLVAGFGTGLALAAVSLAMILKLRAGEERSYARVAGVIMGIQASVFVFVLILTKLFPLPPLG